MRTPRSQTVRRGKRGVDFRLPEGTGPVIVNHREAFGNIVANANASARASQVTLAAFRYYIR